MRHAVLVLALSMAGGMSALNGPFLGGRAAEADGCDPRGYRQGRNDVIVRGQKQYVYRHPARGSSRQGLVLFVEGDGGWRGFAVTIAETVASWGYEVYGLDTKRYLESFTGATTLSPREVEQDLASVGSWIRDGRSDRVTLLGWSEGAGLGLLAVAGAGNDRVFDGLVTMGLGERSVLAWRLRDYLTYLTHAEPDEPSFKSADFLPKLNGIPLAMIQATHDVFVDVETAKRLFALAPGPKRLDLVEASNHRFDGNHDGFFAKLREALGWVSTTARAPR